MTGWPTRSTRCSTATTHSRRRGFGTGPTVPISRSGRIRGDRCAHRRADHLAVAEPDERERARAHRRAVLAGLGDRRLADPDRQLRDPVLRVPRPLAQLRPHAEPGSEWRRLHGSPLITSWWITFVVGTVTPLIAIGLVLTSSISGADTDSFVNAAHVVLAVGSVLAIFVLREINQRQELQQATTPAPTDAIVRRRTRFRFGRPGLVPRPARALRAPLLGRPHLDRVGEHQGPARDRHRAGAGLRLIVEVLRRLADLPVVVFPRAAIAASTAGPENGASASTARRRTAGRSLHACRIASSPPGSASAPSAATAASRASGSRCTRVVVTSAATAPAAIAPSPSSPSAHAAASTTVTSRSDSNATSGATPSGFASFGASSAARRRTDGSGSDVACCHAVTASAGAARTSAPSAADRTRGSGSAARAWCTRRSCSASRVPVSPRVASSAARATASVTGACR